MTDPQLPLDEDLSADAWRERVLAAFEFLRVHPAPLTVETKDGVEVDGRVESLDAGKGRVVVAVPRAPSAGMEPDDEVRLIFVLNESRWAGQARVHYHNDRRNRFTLVLPKRLFACDRRREQRVFLDTAENVKAVFRLPQRPQLEVTGRLSSLSEGGFRMAVEAVVDLRDGHPLDPGDVALEANQLLEGMRLSGLREEPLEADAVVLEVDPQPLGPIVGLRYRRLPRETLTFLRTVVRNRAAAPRELPSATDRSIAEELGGLPEELPDPRPAPPSASPAQQRAKRFKTLALVMPETPARDRLHAYLSAQGFTRVMPAGTMAELAALTRRMPPDVFLVDWPDGPGSELDIVLFLGNHPFASPPRTILACTHATTQLAREANRLGVSQLLVKPYSLDGALVELLLQQMQADEA